MKAVGATNRDVLTVFIGEAGGIGFIGGLGGIGLGWVLAQVINVLGGAFMASQAAQSGGGPPTDFTLAATPLWLPIFALIFATVIGLLSGLYPALQAATKEPVLALKYE
jgi:putative ABC transport system permease protein